MINILIPMAGAGSRFSEAGYEKPKPFIDVSGKPMIVRVLENLKFEDARYILIARRDHLETEHEEVDSIQQNYNAIFIPIEKLTEGTACTVLFAREFINNENPLLIANSDQLVDINISEFIHDALSKKLDGSILTFIDEEKNPKWSFVKINEQGHVVEAKEKIPISKYATVGIYFFTQGQDFVNSAIDMIIANDRVNNEFYTCPTYNYAISQGKKIGTFNMAKSKMNGLGTPEDLEIYLQKSNEKQTSL